MKIIAHRGGKIGKENSLETLTIAARMDTYAVECDIRRTKDGVYVIYHDDNLSRLAGYDATVSGAIFAPVLLATLYIIIGVLTSFAMAV